MTMNTSTVSPYYRRRARACPQRSVRRACDKEHAARSGSSGATALGFGGRARAAAPVIRLPRVACVRDALASASCSCVISILIHSFIHSFIIVSSQTAANDLTSVAIGISTTCRTFGSILAARAR